MADHEAHLWRESGPLTRRPLTAAGTAGPAIRVFAVDDHPLCLRGLASMLAIEGQCQWVGDAASGAEALGVAPALKPDVILIEHRMPEVDGVATLLALQERCPDSRFVLMMGHLDAHEARRALNAGASSVLHKSVSTTDLTLAVRAVHGGQRHITPLVAAAIDEGEREALTRNELTRRELALLELMAQGMENRAIAAELGIAVPTVKFHITNIMSKLHAPNRTAAVLVALRTGLVRLHRKTAATADH